MAASATPSSATRISRWLAVAATLCLLTVGFTRLVPARADADDLPDSIAAIGDSITQATNADLFRIGASNPAQSWATGSDGSDPIVSHYERILVADSAIAGRNVNVAVSGAKMADAPDQAARVVAQGADYVTVLLGANDVCAPSAAAMTSVASFEASFRQAMGTLTAGLPDARIYVVSVPDIYQLWRLQQGNLLALLTWEWFKVCQSILATANTEADRQLARDRNIDLNATLQRVCAQFQQCRFDGNRVFDHRFTAAEVSIVDSIHPSIEGLRNLAEISWKAGYWPNG